MANKAYRHAQTTKNPKLVYLNIHNHVHVVSCSTQEKTHFYPHLLRFQLPVANGFLDLGIDADHLLVQLGVVADHNLRIPACGDEDGIDSTGNRGREDQRNLETNQERESNNHRSEAAVAVVLGLGDEEVDVTSQSAGVTDKHGSERQDGANETFLQVLVVT